VEEYQLGGLLKEGTPIFIFFLPAKCVLKSDAPHVNNNSSPLVVLMLFFTEILQLMVEQTNFCYQQHLDEQARPVC
jgi:hypothetical protein